MTKKKRPTDISKMAMVKDPKPGTFYAISHRLNEKLEDPISIWSEKEFPASWEGIPATSRRVLGEVYEGQMVFYIGPFKYGYHKIGVDDYFGLVGVDFVNFYDLGDLDDG